MTDFKDITNRVHRESGSPIKALFGNRQHTHFAVLYEDERRDEIKGRTRHETERLLMEYLNQNTQEMEAESGD